MTHRSPITAALLLAALAVSLTGCPAPTGRRRGPSDGSGGSCSGSTPSPGGYCNSPGESCSANVYCAATGSYIYDNCYCTGSSWQCSYCSNDGGLRPSDASTCPSSPVHEGEFCSGSLAGTYCPSEYVMDCDGTWRRLYCSCSGARWTCEEPVCIDAGRRDGDTRDVRDAADTSIEPDSEVPPDAPLACPAAPAPGEVCRSGLGCWYPDEGTECRTYCNCEEGMYSCIELPCPDGGGATDASISD